MLYYVLNNARRICSNSGELSNSLVRQERRDTLIQQILYHKEFCKSLIEDGVERNNDQESTKKVIFGL